MKLIVGLGNPGEKFEKTRHNVGFMVEDKIASEKDVIFRMENERQAQEADFNVGEDRIKLAKPQTFMNNSGEAVSKLKNYYKLDTEDIWVIHDDVDLELGKIRVSLGGSSAGHKGIQSIIDQLGTEQFWRVRVGVGRSDQIPTEEWVLMNFEDRAKIDSIVNQTADIIFKALETKELTARTYETE